MSVTWAPRTSIALERAFYSLLREAHLSLARYERDLESATNDIEAAALRKSIRQVRAAIAAAEAV